MHEAELGPPNLSGARDSGRYPVPWAPGEAAERPAPARPDDLLVGVARRLQAQADRQADVLDRLRAAERNVHVLSDLAALDECVRRIRRDADNLLLVAGAGVPPPVRPAAEFADLVNEAISGVDLPARVAVAPLPAATVPSWAVSDLVHVLTEVFDHAAEVAPPAGRIDVIGRWAEGDGITIEVVVDGPGLPAADLDALNGVLAGAPAIAGPQPVGLLAAAQVARRVGIELRLQPRLNGPDLTGPGLISTIWCPGEIVHADLEPSDPPVGPPPQRGVEWLRNGHPAISDLPDLSGPSIPEPLPPEPLSLSLPAASAEPESTRPTPVVGAATGALSPHTSSPDDELFGPLVLPAGSDDDLSATPIYEAVASAWFRDRHRSEETDADDWETPSDAEWRAAAERANRSEGLGTTASGLPRRRPGRQMVAPRRDGGPVPTVGPVTRVPDRVRHQLASYQRGLQHGRHRATDSTSDEAEDVSSWWSVGD